MNLDPLQRFRLTGRTAVVTGALGKLGPVWVSALLGAGAAVCCLDLPGVRPGPDFAAQLNRHPASRYCLVAADVRDRSSLEEALRTCEAELGAPHVLVNNAGIDQPPVGTAASHALTDVPFEACRAVFEVNALGLFQATQVFGGRMAGLGRGSIINIGSMYGSVAPNARLYDHIPCDPPFLKPPAYGASKAAVVNLSRYLATLWASSGVRVNTLSPGGVLGGQDEAFRRKFIERTPMGRMAENDDLIGPLLFLASDASSYVTGTELIVDGGFTCW